MPADALHLDDEALALLALGALAPEEAREVEEHLAGCADCRARLGARLGDLSLLAESVEPVPPPRRVREELLARLDGGPAASVATMRPRRRAAGLLLPLAASFLLGALAGALAVRQAMVGDLARVEARSAELAAERADALRRAERLTRDLAAARAALSLTPAPEAVPLAGLAAAPEARGRVFVDRAGGRAVLVARGLPELPADRSYQLWRIVDGQPRPAGLLDAAEGAVIVEGIGPTPGEVWAVTVEPRGGVAAPSGEMVLLSS